LNDVLEPIKFSGCLVTITVQLKLSFLHRDNRKQVMCLVEGQKFGVLNSFWEGAVYSRNETVSLCVCLYVCLSVCLSLSKDANMFFWFSLYFLHSWKTPLIFLELALKLELFRTQETTLPGRWVYVEEYWCKLDTPWIRPMLKWELP
jgi:hypothetical protein